MIVMEVIYDEVIDFIVSAPSPKEIVGYHPSKETRDKVFKLLRRQKTAELDELETAELKHYLELEHVMRLAKVRAHQILSATTRCTD